MTASYPASASGSDQTATELPPYDRILALACRAPSVFNTQPWQWQVADGRLDLLADRSRRLDRADANGRNLVLSCGAALHHLQVAAAGLGWAPRVRRRRGDERPGHLASVWFSHAPATPEAVRRLTTVETRYTDRRAFAPWPVPPSQIVALVETGSHWGAHVLGVEDESTREQLLGLNARADERLLSDHRYVAELADWVPSMGEARLASGAADKPTSVDGRSEADSLLVLATSSDDTISWLRAGEALSDVWLRATEMQLSVVPLSQGIEVLETREEIMSDLLHDLAYPQILLRVGWPAPHAGLPPARTRRRPVKDVLVPG
jgi:hypothetical protein